MVSPERTERRTSVVTIRFDATTLVRLREVAETTERSVSAVLRVAVKEYLAKGCGVTIDVGAVSPTAVDRLPSSVPTKPGGGSTPHSPNGGNNE